MKINYQDYRFQETFSTETDEELTPVTKKRKLQVDFVLSSDENDDESNDESSSTSKGVC